MRTLIIVTCFAFVEAALIPPTVLAQAPAREGLSRWCEPQSGRCTTVVNPTPIELQIYCNLLARQKQAAINERAGLARQEGQADGESGTANEPRLTELDAREKVFGDHAGQANCPPFVPGAQPPASNPVP